MRAPRRSELQLMALLRDGPKAVTAGPVGRCVKRGWCGVETMATDDKATVRYRLTEAGRGLLDAVPEGAASEAPAAQAFSAWAMASSRAT